MGTKRFRVKTLKQTMSGFVITETCKMQLRIKIASITIYLNLLLFSFNEDGETRWLLFKFME